MLVVGCGGDDSTTVDNGDAGSDTGSDVTTSDAHPDGNVPDASVDATQGDTSPDSPIAVDGSSDSSDSASDADSSVGFDASALLPSQYASVVAQALCTRLAFCCEGNDAAAFDTASCLAVYSDPIGVSEATPYLDSGLVNFNTAQAGACLDDLANFPCGDVNAAQNVMLGQNCIAAFLGTQSTGGPCADPIECHTTDYCAQPGDGGLGTCTPLVGGWRHLHGRHAMLVPR